MARERAPNSADSEFFICIEDEPELDAGGAGTRGEGGYAAFGRVVSGMDVVKKIHRSKADGQVLTPPIRIESMRGAPAGR